MKAWNDYKPGRAATKALGKKLASELAAAIPKRRKAAAVKSKAWRKIGPR